MNLLFVCLGNICRSPAAEGIMRRLVEENGLAEQIFVDSAGTYGGHAGELPDARMRNAARQRGLELSHRARPLREEDFERFDMLLVMDKMNYDDVSELAPDIESERKIRYLVDFCSEPEVHFVPDPYYSGRSGFDRVLDILEDACGGLLRHIQYQNLLKEI